MATLYHATPSENLPSILKSGLLCSKSKGALKAVWAVQRQGIAWACMHVAFRHSVPITDVVVLAIDVPKVWLRRSQKNLYYIPRDIGLECFGAMQTFALVAKRRKASVNGRKRRS
jgi:hypothetical protein